MKEKALCNCSIVNCPVHSTMLCTNETEIDWCEEKNCPGHGVGGALVEGWHLCEPCIDAVNDTNQAILHTLTTWSQESLARHSDMTEPAKEWPHREPGVDIHTLSRVILRMRNAAAFRKWPTFTEDYAALPALLQSINQHELATRAENVKQGVLTK